MKHFFFALALVLGCAPLQAQKDSVTVAPFTDIERFMTDVYNLLRPTKSITNETVLADFRTVWESRLNAEQRQLTFEIGCRLKKMGYGLVPHSENFYACLAYGYLKKNAQPSQITRFLQLVDSTTQLYPFEVNNAIFRATRTYFESGIIYQVGEAAAFRVVGGDFGFGHVLDEELSKGRKVVPKPEAESWFEPEKEEPAKKDEEPEETESDWDGGETSTDWADTEKKISFSPEVPAEQVSGPYITFKNCEIQLISKYCSSAACADTFYIRQTNGTFGFATQKWLGTTGSTTWERFGLAAGADLKNYTLQTTRFKLYAPDALLNYPEKLEKPVQGLLEYESTAANRYPSRARFPRFTSNESNIRVKDMAKDVTYRGGFSIQGKQLFSNSLDGGESMIEVSKEGKLRFRAFSTRPYSFADSVVSNDIARFVAYHQGGKDSIEHLGLMLRYNTATGKLYTRRPKSVYNHTPFTMSYFGTEVSAENLLWDVNTDSIDLNMALAREKTMVEIESKDRFDAVRSTRMVALRKFHPIQVIVSYSREKKVNSFTARAVAQERKLDLRSFRGAMHELYLGGFIHYDMQRDLITLKPKAKLYYNAINQIKGTDYDNMRINSLTNRGANTTIFLDSNTYKANGVNFFLISDSMKVKVTPIDRTVKIKENRRTMFSGKVETRRLIFRGSGFEFKYDSFLIRMPRIDSMSFVKTDSATGASREMDNKILIEKGGVLLISRPRNKSGLAELPEYPRFTATAGGKINFDGKEILGGVYDSSKVYFDIPFIDIDSTNTYDPQNLGIKGTFFSSGMFPDFVDQPISIMDDGSFGFRRPTPKEGYPVYEGKGTFIGEVTLDNKGVRGDGQLDYLNGIFESKDFVYYSDSLKTIGTKGEIKAGVYAKTGASFPHVQMDDYYMDWDTQKDSMVLETYRGSKFKIYDDARENLQYEGNLTYSPKKLSGSGRVETTGAFIESPNFNFKETAFEALNSEVMKIKSDDIKKEAVRGENVNVNYDLKNRYADIEAVNYAIETFSFPYTRFKTSLSKARWDIDQKKVTMSRAANDTSATATFISTSQKQFGLEFTGKAADYDLNDFKLNVYGVPYINIANNLIIPDKGEVVIRRDAEIDRLKKSQVVFNANTTFHKFRDCDIKVKSRNVFEGTGKHDYENESGDKYVLNCSFKVTKELRYDDKKKKTPPQEIIEASATAKIREDSAVKIFPGIIFRGNLVFKDKKKSPEFAGEYTLDIKWDDQPNWLPYVSKDSIRKPIYVNGSNNKEATGIFLEAFGEREVYGSFLEFEPVRAKDIEIFVAKGDLNFYADKGVYIVSPEGKMSSPDSAGNRFIYDAKEKKSNFDGKFEIIKTKENEAKVIAAGKGDADHKNSKFNLNLMLGLEIPLSNTAAQIIAEILANGKTEDAILDPEDFHAKMVDFLPEESLDDYLTQKAVGLPNYLDLLDKYITMPKVNLKWSSDHKSFYSTGKIPVFNIGKYEVNAAVEGFVEVPKENNHNTIYIYLKNGSDWFYFEIEKGTARVFSNNQAFKLEVTKKKEAKIKWADGDRAIQNIIAFKADYLGIQEDVPMPEDEPTFTPKEKPARKKLPVDESEEPTEEETLPDEEPKKEKTKKEKPKKEKKKKTEEEEEEETPEETLPDEEPKKEKPKKEKPKKEKKKKTEEEEEEEAPEE